MADPILFDHDAFTGITEFYHDDGKGGFAIEYVQDQEPVLEQNQRLRNDAGGRMGDMVHIASTPLVVVMDLAQKGILTTAGRILDDKAYRRWLNASENQVFRTRKCRV